MVWENAIPRIQECLSLRPNRLPPSPVPLAIVFLWNQKGGGQHSLAGRGDPIRTTGEKDIAMVLCGVEQGVTKRCRLSWLLLRGLNQ